MGTFGNLLDKHSSQTSPRLRISHPSAGPLPLAPASNPQGAAQELQSNFLLFSFVKIVNNVTIQIKVTVVAPCMFTPIIFVLQEVVPTSNSNTVMSLCRLFEMLLAEPVKQNPKDRNIRTWIMVHELVFTHDLR